MVIKRLFLVFGAVALCATAGPARAGLFDFHVGSLQSVYNSSTGEFAVSPLSTPYTTVVNLVRQESPGGSAQLFGPGSAGFGGNFTISMGITNIFTDSTDPTQDHADGNGAFWLTDVGGDVLHGSIAGRWARTGSANTFAGTMFDVTFASSDGTFDGNWILNLPLTSPPTFTQTSASMDFSPYTVWSGTLTELSSTGKWFGEGSYTTSSGSVDASVSAVPVPPGVLLGFLGLAAAGLKLRRLA